MSGTSVNDSLLGGISVSRDSGRDAGGITRNIARDESVPDIFVNGQYGKLEWIDVCKQFSTKPSEERLKVFANSNSCVCVFMSVYV
jgi:hypothetical protein